MSRLPHLTALEATGLVRLAQIQPELEYLFRHALIQDAAYGSILKAERRTLHGGVARALETLFADRLDDLAPVLARHLEALKDFGGQVTVDTCILASPMLPPEIKMLMTNSAKYAYYSPGLLNTAVTFGSLADCVRSAVEGRVVRDEGLWNE